MSAILLGNFYKIDTLEMGDGSVIAQVTFDVAHEIFKGHFPDMPVVPGVCQTQMLGEVLSEALGGEVKLKSAASIKFLSVVDPTKHPTLKLTISYKITDDGNYNVSAQYTWEDAVFFKCKGIYTS